MQNKWERVFSETKAKSRAESELVHLYFSLRDQNQSSEKADAQDFQLSTCSHIPAQGAQGRSPPESCQCEGSTVLTSGTKQHFHWTQPWSSAPDPSGNRTQVTTAVTKHSANGSGHTLRPHHAGQAPHQGQVLVKGHANDSALHAGRGNGSD